MINPSYNKASEKKLMTLLQVVEALSTDHQDFFLMTKKFFAQYSIENNVQIVDLFSLLDSNDWENITIDDPE